MGVPQGRDLWGSQSHRRVCGLCPSVVGHQPSPGGQNLKVAKETVDLEPTLVDVGARWLMRDPDTVTQRAFRAPCIGKDGCGQGGNYFCVLLGKFNQ